MLAVFAAAWRHSHTNHSLLRDHRTKLITRLFEKFIITLFA